MPVFFEATALIRLKLTENSGDYPRCPGDYRPFEAEIQEIPYVMS